MYDGEVRVRQGMRWVVVRIFLGGRCPALCTCACVHVAGVRVEKLGLERASKVKVRACVRNLCLLLFMLHVFMLQGLGVRRDG